ncbi:hypothetical protein HYW36_00025 [Candidatus Saccharibacteria bacterium]|nr:hypothetical protein [Candidatus Saccharibacteria bacterium]
MESLEDIIPGSSRDPAGGRQFNSWSDPNPTLADYRKRPITSEVADDMTSPEALGVVRRLMGSTALATEVVPPAAA